MLSPGFGKPYPCGNPAQPFRLKAGQVLAVNNRRMLHGREGLLPNRARRLRRLWIRTSCHFAHFREVGVRGDHSV